MESGATFSGDRVYRYQLWRTWDPQKDSVAFIMLNPSTADEKENDPTIKRCIQYAKDWGYGSLIVGNIFALVSSDPEKLLIDSLGYDPIGPDNNAYLSAISMEADKTIIAWGNYGKLMNRGEQVLRLLLHPHYLRLNKITNEPSHPLYLPRNLKPHPYQSEFIKWDS